MRPNAVNHVSFGREMQQAHPIESAAPFANTPVCFFYVLSTFVHSTEPSSTFEKATL